MHFTSVEFIFKAFNQCKVLVIGDAMIDAYTWGKVTRISPEAPVPIVHACKKEKKLGGAANVALNIQALGAKPILCTIIGHDAAGEKFYNLMANAGLSTVGIMQRNECTTTVKERILAGKQQILRIDEELIQPLSDIQANDLITIIKQYIGQADVVIFEDYDKGCLTPQLIKAVVCEAHKKGIPIVADPKRKNFFAYENVTLFKPNLKELQDSMGKILETIDQETLIPVVRNLKGRLKINMALITLSELGVYIDSKDECHLIAAKIRNIADVAGAGDTVVSIAALCLALNLTPKFMAMLANLGGGLVCEYPGIMPINKKKLMQEALDNRIFCE